MDEIGLFPLGIVLLPTERIPLHIFEPRYRELIGECVARDEEFGLVLADDEGVREIGTRASVVDVAELPDGRLDVVVEGGGRFRLVELTEGRSFSTGRIASVEDGPDPASAEDVARAVGLFDRVVELTGSGDEIFDASDPQLSFVLAGRFDLQPGLKQQLLAETSERVRLEHVSQVLEDAVARMERQRAVHSLAKRNGDARSRPA